MTNILIGIGIAVVSFGVIYKITKKIIKNNDNGSEMCMMSGEMIDVVFDQELQLTHISIRDSRGVTQYGFSALTPGQLEALYAGKGYVTIPVIRNR